MIGDEYFYSYFQHAAYNCMETEGEGSIIIVLWVPAMRNMRMAQRMLICKDDNLLCPIVKRINILDYVCNVGHIIFAVTQIVIR